MSTQENTHERNVLSGGKTKDEFYRELFLDFATSKKTPADIFDCSLSDLTETQSDIFEIYAQAEVNYSCTVGYDRKVTQDGRKSYISGETVTDWKPFSGRLSGQSSIILSANDDRDDIYGMKVLLNAENCGAKYREGDVEDAPTPSTYQLEMAKDRAISDVTAKIKGKLPGDRYKDFSSSGVAQIERVVNYSVPEYHTEVTYRNQEYQVFGSTIPNMTAFSYGGIPTEEKNDKDIIKKKTRPLRLSGFILTIGAFITAIILSMTIGTGNALNYMWLVIPGVIVLVICQVYANISQKRILTNRQNQKIIGVQKKLMEYGLSPLTEAEKKAMLKV